METHYVSSTNTTLLMLSDPKSKSKLYYDRQSVCRLGVRHPSGTSDQFFFLLEIFFRQLRVCYFVAPSLTRERVCNLLFLLVLDSAVPLGFESADHILLSQFLTLSQPGRPGPRIYEIHIEQVKVKVTLRPTISRPVLLGVRRPSGTRDQFFFLLEFFF
jgi:hypothetical protein